MISLHNIRKHYGGKAVLDGVNFQINPGEKLALVGANGCGKTTLLRIIAGKVEPDKGVAANHREVTSAILSQEVTVRPENTLEEEMRLALPDVVEMERRLRILETEMEELSDDQELMEEAVERYTALHERYTLAEGADLSWKIDVVIQGLGFNLEDKKRLVSTFSGGWQMRIELAKLLLQDVELLLLDEPTNHLDLKAVEWVEEFMQSYKGALVVVSHDRFFLNRVTNQTCYLYKGKLKKYNGNYDYFIKKHRADLEQQQHEYIEQQRKIEQAEKFINRFRAKATLASRVKSKQKMLDRMEMAEKPDWGGKGIKLRFSYLDRVMTLLYDFKDMVKEYPGKRVPLMGKMEIAAGEKISILGENGCGKTTLLKILGRLDKQNQGRLKIHPAAEISCYLQNQAEHLNPNNEVFEELQSFSPELSQTELRTILGCFLFKDEDVFKPVGVLSGGEKARLALAGIVSTPCNVLLLDEPTNHLDMDSREILADSLKDFKGTVIIVSHDRYFINQVCSRVIEIENGGLASYPGDYSYYRRKKKAMQQSQSIEVQKPKKEPLLNPHRNVKTSGTVQKINKGRIRDEIVILEDAIEKLEEEISALEEQIQLPKNVDNPEVILDLSEEYADRKSKLDEKMETWEEMHSLLE